MQPQIFVTPAKAGAHGVPWDALLSMDPGLRRDDEKRR